jgi:hypothetical protein
MADRIPIKRHVPEDGLAEFQATDSIAILHGGTGANDLPTAKTNLEIVTNLSTINGQPHITFTDSTRTKELSTGIVPFLWAEANVGGSDWIQIGTASDALTGHIMPFDGTIVGYAVHCENTQGNTRVLDLHIGLVLNGIIAVPAGTDISNFDNTINLDFIQGDKLRIRGEGSGGQILDTVITVYVRWRA